MNSNNPEFIKSVRSVWLFETTQLMKIRVFHADKEAEFVEDESHMIGETTFTLSKLFETHRNRVLNCGLTNYNQGSVEIRVDSVVENRDYANIQFSCNLNNTTNWVSSPRPFIILKRINEDKSWTTVMSYTDKEVKPTLSPDFRAINIPLSTVCNGDVYCPMLLQVYDCETDHKHDLIGQVETSIHALIASNGEPLYLKTANGDPAGTLRANHASVTQRPTITDVSRRVICFFPLDFSSSFLFWFSFVHSDSLLFGSFFCSFSQYSILTNLIFR
jgi:hypothetical protein